VTATVELNLLNEALRALNYIPTHQYRGIDCKTTTELAAHIERHLTGLGACPLGDGLSMDLSTITHTIGTPIGGGVTKAGGGITGATTLGLAPTSPSGPVAPAFSYPLAVDSLADTADGGKTWKADCVVGHDNYDQDDYDEWVNENGTIENNDVDHYTVAVPAGMVPTIKGAVRPEAVPVTYANDENDGHVHDFVIAEDEYVLMDQAYRCTRCGKLIGEPELSSFPTQASPAPASGVAPAPVNTDAGFRIEWKGAGGWETVHGHDCETVEDAEFYVQTLDPSGQNFRVVA
jgi:hypothetical protein